MILMSLVVLLAALGCLATPTVPKYDTIVVGLGSAGATAASTLARAGRRVLALDAQPRVGGRVRTEDFGDGVVELGAEWIDGLSPSRVYDAAVQNNVSVLVQELPLVVYRADGSGQDATLTELFDYCLQVMGEGSERPESTGQLIERKLKQHLAKTKPELLQDEQLQQFLGLMERAVNWMKGSSSYRDVSTHTTYERLNGSSYGSWHRHGYRTFFEILLNTYNGGPGLPTLDIKLNKEVTSVQWSARGVRVRCADGAQYSADNVVVTVSLGVLKERHAQLFTPALPEDKVTAIETISMGVLDKVVLVFDQPRPEEDAFTMFYWSADDVSTLPAKDRWVTRFVGSSPPAGSGDTVTLWIAGDDAKLMESLPEELVRQKAVALLQRFAGHNVTVPQPAAMIRSTWFTNPFTRGTNTFDNVEMASHPGLRDVLGAPLTAGGAPRVLFAGEATNTKHFGTVHGASETGYREAQRILAGQ